MSQEYYIIAGKNSTGPYDIVMLVKKIRNGSLASSTPVRESESDTIKPAGQWPILSEFFHEIVQEKPDSGKSSHVPRSLSQAIRSGWRFLQGNQVSTLFSGLLVLSIILFLGISTIALPPAFRPLAYMTGFVLGHFLMSGYLLIVLRMTRGQPVDVRYIQEKIGPVAGQLALLSLMVSFVAIIGLLLLTASSVLPVTLFGLLLLSGPGLFAIALYCFAPLLMLDQKYAFWDAMEASRKAVLKSGLENAGVIYALFVINFIGGVLVLLPLAITLPMTLSAVAEIYDEMFV